MTVAVGVGLMEFPFASAAAYWRWIDMCEAGGIDSMWQTDRLVSREPILECMCRTDFVVETLAGIQIVVHPIYACVLEFHCLLRLQQSQTTTDVQAVLILDLTHNTRDMIDFTICRTATAGDNTICA